MCRSLIKSTKVSRTFFLILCCGSPVLRSLILHSSSTLPTLKNIYIYYCTNSNFRLPQSFNPQIRRKSHEIQIFSKLFQPFPACLKRSEHTKVKTLKILSDLSHFVYPKRNTPLYVVQSVMLTSGTAEH